MSDYGLGRLVAKDKRDAQYPMRPLVDTAVVLPRSYYYSTPRTMPYDQGQTPMCVGYSFRGLLSAGRVTNPGGPDAPTIYREAQKRDEWSGENYNGTSARGACKYLQEMGYISTYVWANDTDTMVRWLGSGNGPLCIGIPWYDSMFTPDASGTLRITPTAHVVGGHELLVIGYSDDREAFRVPNSWGRSWGQNGRAWLPYGAMGRLFIEDADCVAASELKVP